MDRKRVRDLPDGFVNYTEKQLSGPSDWNRDVRNERNNGTKAYGDNVQRRSKSDPGYGNFMNLTTSPQNNPYGIDGNKNALKNLELQLPNRKTTQNNPMGNVPIRDFGRQQQFGKATEGCDEECKQNLTKSLFRSPSDALWNRQSSERQFYTTPNSSVPNEQNKFAQWLYGKNHVCKSGSIYDRYGYPYTPDSLVCNGNNAASPENGGQTENNFGTPVMNPQGSFWVNNPNYGYGFGGIPNSINPPNLTMSSPQMFMNPTPLVTPEMVQSPYMMNSHHPPIHMPQQY
jgi:hypothetical protein